MVLTLEPHSSKGVVGRGICEWEAAPVLFGCVSVLVFSLSVFSINF